MSQAFNSFDESPLGAFMESPLHARGISAIAPTLFCAIHNTVSSGFGSLIARIFTTADPIVQVGADIVIDTSVYANIPPAICTMIDGSVAIVFSKYIFDSPHDTYRLETIQVWPDGRTNIKGAFTPVLYNPGYDNLFIAGLSDGGYVVCFTDHSGGLPYTVNMEFNVFSGSWPAGIPSSRTGNIIALQSTGSKAYDMASLCALADGGFMVSATSWALPTHIPPFNQQIVARRFTNMGILVGSEFNIYNENTNVGYAQIWSVLIGLKTSGFVCLYQKNTP
jgi:hypothetical protein